MNFELAAQAFTALGQSTRLELMRALLAAGPNGISPGDAAARLVVPGSTLSFHLKALEQAGLVAATRRGRSLLYSAQIAQLRALMAFLADACCDGDPFDTSGPPRISSPDAFNVLFLCTRNSARSIMAEAILAKLAPGRFVSHSASSDPAPEGPMSEVIVQLKALGHDVSALRSKSWDEFTGADARRMDFVIALCDVLAGQIYPDFGDAVVTASWPLPDPAKFNGNAAERATMLNELYAALHRRLSIFASLPFPMLDRRALKARIDALARPA